MKKQVSIIITARNYGRFLSECIESCLCQTERCEVFYSDDCSDDESVAIARQYSNVTVLAHKKHIGVAAARNAGAKAAKGRYLLFVDGDDVLTPDYVERHLEVMDDGVPFVYGSYQMFGLAKRHFNPPHWGEKSLWQRNFCNSSSLVNAQVFWLAGGWVETSGHTLWDWSLFLRCSRFGTPRKSSALLLYRQHCLNNRRTKADRNHAVLTKQSRQRELRMSVGIVYGGRIPGLLPEFMDCLTDDLKVLNHRPELIIVNNSGREMPKLNDWADAFSSIRVLSGRSFGPWVSEQERRLMVSTLLADSYNLIQQVSSGDVIHLREDDILTEAGSFDTLYNCVTEGVSLKAGVAGLYRNRHHARPVGGHFQNRIRESWSKGMLKVSGPASMKVDFTGTGCLIYWKDLAPAHFHPLLDGVQAHDWRWGHDLKKLGQELWLMPSAPCRHYADEDNYVLPDIGAPVNGQNNHTRIHA